MANGTWGISETGFYCPTYEEILNENIKNAKELFGDDIVTDSASVLGKYLRLLAKKDRRIYEMAESVYYSASPATATGISLDRAVSYARITRNTAIAAVHLIRVYGTKDYVINIGKMFRSARGIQFYAIQRGVINEEAPTDELDTLYYTDIKVQCIDAGTVGNTNSITGTVQTDVNITSVNWIETVTYGADTESDSDLYARYSAVSQGLGSNTGASIIAAVRKINGVHNCIIRFNNSDEDMVISEELTIEAGTYGVIVYADESYASAIANAIFSKMPLGIRQSGTTVISVQDQAKEYHNVKFSFVEEKEVDTVISCTVNSDFGTTGLSVIRESIKNYIDSLEIGESLKYSKLYKYIFDIAGIDDVSELTVDGGTVNIEISDAEIIRCGNITVHITEV